MIILFSYQRVDGRFLVSVGLLHKVYNQVAGVIGVINILHHDLRATCSGAFHINIAVTKYPGHTAFCDADIRDLGDRHDPLIFRKHARLEDDLGGVNHQFIADQTTGGKNAFPLSPTLDMKPSIRKAARDM